MSKYLQNLFLIGGGVMRNGETINLDKWLVRKATNNKKVPNVLFVPTASKDLPEYIDDFVKRYTSYGARVDVLLLANNYPSTAEVSKKILTSDLIYFGGGNMDLAFEKFKKYNLAILLRKAVRKGTLVGGLSAGASMFGDFFLDFEWNGAKFVNFRLDRGYGWIKYTIWTHFTNDFLENKEATSVLPANKEILGIGDGVLVYWDQDNNIKTVANTGVGVCVLGKFSKSILKLTPILHMENATRNI